MSVIAGRKGSNFATYAEVVSQPLPLATESYAPISNRDLIDMVEYKAKSITGYTPVGRSFVLGAKGSQMFGAISLDTGDTGRTALVGFANSYNKSRSVRVVSGAQIMVCSNMCISGDAFSGRRKHTPGAVVDVEKLVEDAVRRTHDTYREVAASLDTWKSMGLSWEKGAEALGVMFFEGLLSPRQTSIAMKDWRDARDGNPRHEEFAENTVYSLYNCVTEGLKNGPANSVTDRFSSVHEWMVDTADRIAA